jgi:hypothetical protein
VVGGEVADFGWVGRGNWKVRGSRILGLSGWCRRGVERRAGLWLVGLFGGCWDKDRLPGLCLRPCELCGTYVSIHRRIVSRGRVGSYTMDKKARQQVRARLNESGVKKTANVQLRGIYKWVLEFVRNCMVVAALFYVARRSGDWWIYGIAVVSGFALSAYCFTYVENVWFDYKMPYTGRRRNVALIVGACVVQLILTGITIGLYVTLDKIVTVQMQVTKTP